MSRSQTSSVAQRALAAEILNGLRLVGGEVELTITSFCAPQRLEADPGPDVADADAGLLTMLDSSQTVLLKATSSFGCTRKP